MYAPDDMPECGAGKLKDPQPDIYTELSKVAIGASYRIHVRRCWAILALSPPFPSRELLNRFKESIDVNGPGV